MLQTVIVIVINISVYHIVINYFVCFKKMRVSSYCLSLIWWLVHHIDFRFKNQNWYSAEIILRTDTLGVRTRLILSLLSLAHTILFSATHSDLRFTLSPRGRLPFYIFTLLHAPVTICMRHACRMIMCTFCVLYI